MIGCSINVHYYYYYIKPEPSQKSIEPEKTNPDHVPTSTSQALIINKRNTRKVPRTSTIKKDPEKLTEKLVKYAKSVPTVQTQKFEAEPALVMVTRHLPEEEYDYNSFPPKKESAIGYFPSPEHKAKPDDRDRECSGYELPD